MSLIELSGIFLIILIISMIHEPRSYWNAFLLIITLGVFTLGLCTRPGIFGRILGIFIMLIPVIFIIIAILLIINGFQMMKKEGRRLQNLLPLLTGIAMIAGSILTVTALYYFQDSKVLSSLLALVLLLEFYISFAFVALLIYSAIYTYIPKRLNCDYIIVHGCGLLGGERISPLLKGRVDKAVRVYHKCKKHTKLIVSGGQGSDEKISEAEAMKNYLLETGFPQDDIILEDKSKTTFENLKNVRDMLDIDGAKHHYLFVTNNYHVFRTGLFARKLKMKANGVGCRTAFYYWPGAFIREYVAIMVKYKWIFAVITALWGLGLILIYR